MKMFRFFPVDSKGNLIKGFCPTLCDEIHLSDSILSLVSDLVKYGIKFNDIKVIPA